MSSITDACVYPRPIGDSSVRRMALEAREVGVDSLVAVDAPACEIAGVRVFRGIRIRETSAKEVLNRLRRGKKTQAVVSVQAGDNGFNRAILGMRGVHILCGIHGTDKLAFDHVTARMAADNGVAIDLSLSPLIQGRGVVRQQALNRYLDLMVLYRRFEFPLVISTHARSVLEMRSVREISALVSLVGLDVPDVERVLGNVTRILSPEHAVRVIR